MRSTVIQRILDSTPIHVIESVNANVNKNLKESKMEVRLTPLKKAAYFAISKHGNQMYKKLPYFYHLEQVVQTLEFFGYGTEENILIAGYLHDIIEDTPTSYNELVQNFNIEVAEIVYAVTDELGKNRKERKLRTMPKIKANRKAIVVKLADRITNVSSGGELNDMYIQEYKQFREDLYNTFESDERVHAMWRHLDAILLTGAQNV